MLVLQWPSLPHHIPFIVVVGLSWHAVFSVKPSLKLKARPLYSCVIKGFICFGKELDMKACLSYKNEHVLYPKRNSLLKKKIKKKVTRLTLIKKK